MSAAEPSPGPSYRYDAFLSYSTDPDYRLVRHTEEFLEAFHRIRTPGDLALEPLEIYVDESGSLPPREVVGPASGRPDPIWERLAPGLEQSRVLIVFCSRKVRESHYVDREIQWFLENRGPGCVFLAVTEGDDPAADPDSVIPRRLIAAGVNEKPWFDLRGFRARDARGWTKVRDFDQARVNLAVELINGRRAPDRRLGSDRILPLWYREQRRRLDRRNRIAVGVAAIMTGLAAAILSLQQLAATRARVNLASTYAALGEAARPTSPLRGVLLSAAAPGVLAPGDPHVPAVEQSLRDGLAHLGGQGLARHEGGISCAVIDPEGRWLASGGSDRKVVLWDLRNPTPAHTATVLDGGFTWTVGTAAFSPDGRWLVAAAGFGGMGFLVSPDHFAAVWDLRREGAPGPPVRIEGHTGEVSVVAFSPNGQRLATGSEDHTVRVHEFTAQGPASDPLVLKGHDEEIVAIVFDKAGDRLATAARDGTVAFWDLTSVDRPVKPKWSIPRRGRGVVAVDIAPNLRRIATSSGEGTVRIYDPSRTRPDDPVQELPMEKAPSFLARFSPDGRWLVTAPGFVSQFGLFVERRTRGLLDYRTTRIWDLDAADPRVPFKTLAGGEEAVYACAFSPDSRWLATAGSGGTVRVWDLQDGNAASAPEAYPAHDGDAWALALTDRWLVSGSQEHTLRIWRREHPDHPSWPRVLGGHRARVRHVALDPRERWLATASDAGTVHLWDLHDLESTGPRSVLRAHERGINGLAFVAEGTRLVTSSGDDTVKVWGAGEDPPARPFRTLTSPGVTRIAVSPDGRAIVAGAFLSGRVLLWRPDEADVTRSLQVLSEKGETVTCLCLDPDRARLAVGRGNGDVELHNLGKTSPSAVLRPFKGHTGSVTSLAFSANGRWLLSGSGDDTARVWDLRERTGPAVVLKGHRENVNAVVFSPCCRYVFTASADGTIRRWDLTHDDPAGAFVEYRGHRDWVTTLALDESGRVLVSGGNDRTALLWYLEGAGTASPPSIVLGGHTDDVSAVALSPSWIVTASYDGTARLHPLPMAPLMKAVPRVVGRDFTDSEVQQYFPGRPGTATTSGASKPRE